MGYDRFLRIYRTNGLQVWPRKKRRVRYIRGTAIAPATRPNQRWSVDFMHDRLANGRQFRALTIGGDFTKEFLARRSRIRWVAATSSASLKRSHLNASCRRRSALTTS